MEKVVKKKSNVITIVLLVILVGLIISNILVWISFRNLVTSLSSLQDSFNEEKTREKRVYFIEKQSTMVQKDTGEFCSKLCDERYYDGNNGGELAHNGTFFVYDCSCYMVVR